MSSLKCKAAAALHFLSAAFPAALLYPAIADVWAVGDGEKVFRYDTEHRSRNSNSIWDGNTVRLRGLYNEVLAFQIIAVADSQGAKAVEITVGAPLHGESGMAIGSSAPRLYGPGGTLEVFSQHYIHVKTPTPPSWLYEGPEAAPEKMAGWIPDALIPYDAKPGTGGFPLDIPPTAKSVSRRWNNIEVTERVPYQNQGFWVDLHLPRDKDFPPGLYKGEIGVWEGGRQVASIPYQVELLPVYLPEENHSTVWMFTEDVEDYFPDLSSEQVERMIKFECHRHRIDAIGGFPAHRSAFDPAIMKDYRPYLDGSAFTPATGYRGPGEGTGEKLFPVGMYSSITNSAFANEALAREESDKWVSWFEANAPDVDYFWYIIDEPGEVQFPWIKERAGWVHDNPGPGSRLPVFTTRRYLPELADAIDIWCASHSVDVEKLAELKKQGKQHWFYNGGRPAWGSTVLDMEAVDLRMIGWAKFIYGLDTWFYWHGTQWRHNFQFIKSRLHQRVFSYPVTFSSSGKDLANGEGVMFYPGRMPFYPEEDRGLNRLLPSIRLNNIRRGQQDYEIMWLAAQKAGHEKVAKMAREAVPAAYSEVDRKGPTPWSQRGNDYDRVRDKFLDLLLE
jgi:Glycoside hydrolase 123, catalytic domain